MKPLPSFRQLRFFVAAADHLHFGKAADVCLVGQSTLSAGIQELEQILGVRLLERTRRSVALTPIGKDLAERARALLKGAEDLVDAALSAQDPLAGPLRLGVIPTIGPFLLPRAMPALRQALPDLKLFLREEQSAALIGRLEAGEIDAVLLALPYPTAGYATIEIARDPFWAVVPTGHALASRSAVAPAEIAREELLLLEEGHCLRGHALAACELESRRDLSFQGTSLHTLAHMVANGIGSTLLPQMAIDAGLLRGLDVSAAPLADAASARRIGLVFRANSGRRATCERLAEELRALFA